VSATIDPKVKRRRLFVRLGLVVVYLGLTALVFTLGKGHTIIVDDKDAEDGSYSAMDGILVSVDGQEPLEMYKGDRDKAVVKGQSHRVTIEAINSGNKTEKRIRLPLGEETLLLSVPKLVAGIAPAVEPFVMKNQAPPVEEAPASNEFTSPGSAEAPAAPTTP
jgi:hypothetical protein